MKPLIILIKLYWNLLCFKILTYRVNRIVHLHFISTPQHSIEDGQGEIGLQQYRLKYNNLFFRRGIRWRKMNDLSEQNAPK